MIPLEIVTATVYIIKPRIRFFLCSFAMSLFPSKSIAVLLLTELRTAYFSTLGSVFRHPLANTIMSSGLFCIVQLLVFLQHHLTCRRAWLQPTFYQSLFRRPSCCHGCAVPTSLGIPCTVPTHLTPCVTAAVRCIVSLFVCDPDDDGCCNDLFSTDGFSK